MASVLTATPTRAPSSRAASRARCRPRRGGVAVLLAAVPQAEPATSAESRLWLFAALAGALLAAALVVWVKRQARRRALITPISAPEVASGAPPVAAPSSVPTAPTGSMQRAPSIASAAPPIDAPLLPHSPSPPLDPAVLAEGAAFAREALLPPRSMTAVARVAPPDPAPGDVVGRYQLLARATETTSRMWAARQVGSPLARLVALELAVATGTPSNDERRWFVEKARIATLIRHPNVIGVHELADHGGLLYQVLEWCDGVSLAQLLAALPSARLDPAIAAKVIAKVSAGLHAAHELEDDDGRRLGAVHGAVSPAKILISSQGQVKVTDFGLERGRTPRAEALAYRAPELRAAQPADARADVFALGVIAYEATTGRRPEALTDGAPREPARSVHVVPPSRLVVGYPEGLERVVLAALASDREQRPSAEQLGVALDGWLARTGTVITEQQIAALVTRHAGELIRERARRIEAAMARFAGTDSAPLDELLGPSPSRSGVGSDTSVPPPPAAPARPTVPAGPRARKRAAP